MKKTSLGYTITAFLMLLTLGIAASPAPKEKTGKSPKLLVVKFHADWCGNCKSLGSSLHDLKSMMDGKEVLFVNLDLTNQTTSHGAMMLAGGLGLGKIVEENKGTGYMLVIDAKTMEVKGKITKKHSLYDMKKLILENLS